MQQIYRRPPIPKCDFNTVAKQLYWNHTLASVFSCKFAAYFQNTSPKSTSGGLHLFFSLSNWEESFQYGSKNGQIFVEKVIIEYKLLVEQQRKKF